MATCPGSGKTWTKSGGKTRCPKCGKTIAQLGGYPLKPVTSH